MPPPALTHLSMLISFTIALSLIIDMSPDEAFWNVLRLRWYQVLAQVIRVGFWTLNDFNSINSYIL